MPENLEVSIDEYMSKRSFGGNVVYRAAGAPKSLNADSRSATIVMTDETPDRHGDIVRAKGVDITNFSTNPIALKNHNYDKIVGSWSNISKKKTSVEGLFTAAAPGTSRDADEVWALMGQGILKAASIGFIPVKMKMMVDEKGNPLWSYDIEEAELIECSIVSVPANPAALAKSIKDGHGAALEYIEYILDTYTKDASGLILPIEALTKARQEGIGNTTSVVVKTLETPNAEVVIDGELAKQEDIKEFAAEIQLITDAWVDKSTQTITEQAKQTLSERVLASFKGLFAKSEETAPAPAPEPVPADPVALSALAERLKSFRERHVA